MSEEQSRDETPLFDFELIYPRPGTKVLVDQEPTGRSGHAMVADESNLYVLGGYNPLGRVLNQGRPAVLEELWKFSFATRKWSKIETTGFPSTCASSCLVMRGSILYVFGGTSYPFGQRVSNTFKVCDLASPRRERSGGQGVVYDWSNLLGEVIQPPAPPDDVNIPPKGYGQSIIFYDEYLYTFGGAVGFYNEAISDMHRLSLATFTWEKLTPSGEEPDGRYKQEIVRDQNCFYIVGGGRLHAAQAVHILYCYTFATNTWSKHSVAGDPVYGTPKPRSAFGLVQVNRDVYICGGQFYGINNAMPEILNDMWHFSLDTFRWSKLPVTLPERMYFHRSAVSPSRHMYVYGGVLESGKRSHKIYCYRLPYQVAELQELCWFRVCRLWKDLHRADPKQLVESYGIPQRFIHRVS